MMNYNILLACPAGTIVSPALLGAATQVWQWNSLVRGEGLLSVTPSPADPRPPDGPSGGGSPPRQTTPKPTSPSPIQPVFRGPDGNGSPPDSGDGNPNSSSVSPLLALRPKAAQESSIPPNGAASSAAPLQASSAAEERRELAKEGASESLPREIPTAVLQQLRNFMASHPGGIMLADVQACIQTGKLPLERDFYGHRKIVPFLSSLPHIVRVERMLMKDNKTWSYLLTPTEKPAQTKQKGCKTTADNKVTKKTSTAGEDVSLASKVSLKGTQEKAPEVIEVGSSSTKPPPKGSLKGTQVKAPEVSKVGRSTEQPPKTSPAEHKKISAPQLEVEELKAGVKESSGSTKPPPKISLKGTQGKAPEGSKVGSRSTEQPPKTSPADHKKISAPQSEVEEFKVGVEESRAGVQLNGESSETPLHSRKSDQRDANVEDEKAQPPRLHSVFSSVMTMFRRVQEDPAVGNSTSFPQVASPMPTQNGHSDVTLKESIRPEDSSTNFAKVEDRVGKSDSSEGVVAEGIPLKPSTDDRKQRSLVGDGGSEGKSVGVSDEGASRETSGHLREHEGDRESTVSVGKAEGEGSKRSWKTWLWGPTEERSPSAVGGSSNTGSSVSSAVYDLSDLDNLTWKELLSWPRQPAETSRGSECESSSSPSSAAEGQRLEHGNASGGHVLEDLKEFLRSPEGAAIFSKAPNLAAVVDTLQTTGPHKFRGLQSSQVSDLVDHLAKIEAGLQSQLSPAPNSHSDPGIDRKEAIFSHGEGDKKLPLVQEAESPIVAPHEMSKLTENISTRSDGISSSSENIASTLKPEDRITSPESDAVLLSDTGSIPPTASSIETDGSGPSLLEFQEWMLRTVKEAFKSSERTQRLGFDLSLVKPEFEKEFGVRLDPRAYGFVRLPDLVASIDSVRLSKPRCDMCVVHLLKEAESFPNEDQQSTGDGPKASNGLEAGKWPQMYHDCKSLVRELMLENPEGVPGTKLKPLFQSRFQYPLDHKPLGYPTMSDLLRMMPDVVSVKGKLLVPSEELLLSLKSDEAARRVARREGGVAMVEEGGGGEQSPSQSSQDAGLEQASVESLESWGEIDKEQNGSPSQGGHAALYDQTDTIGLNESQARFMREVEDGVIEIYELYQHFVSHERRAKCPEHGLQGGLIADGPASHEGREDPNFGGGPLAAEESPVLGEKAPGNDAQLVSEVGDGLEPPVGELEGWEWRPNPRDVDGDGEDKLISIEETEKEVLCHSEDNFAPVVQGNSGGVKMEEEVKEEAGHEDQRVVPKTDGSLDVLLDLDGGIAVEILPSTDEGPTGLDDAADCGQPPESEASQNLQTTEREDEDFDTEKSPEGPIEPDAKTQSFTEKGFVEVVGDDLLCMESEVSSQVREEPFIEQGTEAVKADGLSEASNEEITLLISEEPSTLIDHDLATNGTVGSAELPQERDGPAVGDHTQPLQDGECQTSAVVSVHDDKSAPTAAGETTEEGGKEGESQSGSPSSPRPSLKSLWKRMFS